MTNVGGPGFFFLVSGLVMLAGAPVLVATWLGMVRYLHLGVVRTLGFVTGGMFVLGLVMVTLWSMPLLLEEFTPDALTYLCIYVGTAIGVIGDTVDRCRIRHRRLRYRGVRILTGHRSCQKASSRTGTGAVSPVAPRVLGRVACLRH